MAGLLIVAVLLVAVIGALVVVIRKLPIRSTPLRIGAGLVVIAVPLAMLGFVAFVGVTMWAFSNDDGPEWELEAGEPADPAQYALADLDCHVGIGDRDTVRMTGRLTNRTNRRRDFVVHVDFLLDGQDIGGHDIERYGIEPRGTSAWMDRSWVDLPDDADPADMTCEHHVHLGTYTYG